MQVGLGLVLELVTELLQVMQKLLVSTVYRLEGVREAVLSGTRSQVAVLAELGPVRQIRELPSQVQQFRLDLQELSRILLQLVINTTPLYNLVRKPLPRPPPRNPADPARDPVHSRDANRLLAERKNPSHVTSVTMLPCVLSCRDLRTRKWRTS